MLKYFLLVLVALAGCTKSTPKAPVVPAEAGRRLYMTHCIACHAADPRVDGAVGPAIYGSSLDLLENRVLRTTYPPGYKAKRTTKIMPPLPFLKDEIPNLHAFLNSP